MIHPVKKIEKPWGYELIVAHTSRYVGKILHIDAGESLSLQYHQHKVETIFVQSGSLCLEAEEAGELVRRRLRVGDSYHIEAGQKHRFSAENEACDLFEVSTPELDDIVRLEDRYGRVPGTVEGP